MKVLHIISSGGMYGAEAVILNLSRVLNEGHHSSVIGVFSNSSNPNLQLHKAALKEKIESNLISCDGQVDRTVVASIRKLVAQTGADVVHAHGYKADVYVYLALRGRSTPFISTCHSWLDHGLATSLYGILDRFILRKYAAVVAVSDEVKLRLYRAGVDKDRVHFIRNGIDLRPYIDPTASLRRDARTFTVGWIGRLSKEKGPDIFLRAASQVLVVCPDTRFVMVGDGPELDVLRNLADELGIGDCVSLIGRRDDMPAVYASLDVMVSSSRQEGLPMAILEGMASALPLVATAVGDVPRMIRDGSTGVLVPSEDVKLLAEGIIKLLQDSTLRKRLGAAARKLVEEEYSAARMAADYLLVYNKAIRVEETDGTGRLRVSPLNSKNTGNLKKVGK